MRLKLTPESEKEYLALLTNATDAQKDDARLLQYAALPDKGMPDVPAPIYIRQAVWLSRNGYKLDRGDAQVRED